MFKKIKELSSALVIALSMGLSVPVLAPAVIAHAAPTNVTSGLCKGITSTETEDGSATAEDCTASENGGQAGINRIIKNVINIFSLIIGAVAVIMIIYGGFKYVTSGGNDSNVSGAKNTIMYALIGLVIVAFAQVIVRYVLNKATV